MEKSPNHEALLKILKDMPPQLQGGELGAFLCTVVQMYHGRDNIPSYLFALAGATANKHLREMGELAEADVPSDSIH